MGSLRGDTIMERFLLICWNVSSSNLLVRYSWMLLDTREANKHFPRPLCKCRSSYLYQYSLLAMNYYFFIVWITSLLSCISTAIADGCRSLKRTIFSSLWLVLKSDSQQNTVVINWLLIGRRFLQKHFRSCLCNPFGRGIDTKCEFLTSFGSITRQETRMG